jgi:hypothetical protein
MRTRSTTGAPKRPPSFGAILPVAAAWVILAWADAVHAERVQVQMQSDKHEVALGDSFMLSIQVDLEDADADAVELPDLDDFDILRRQVSRPMQFSFSFGNTKRTVRSSTHHSFLLQPRAVGRFTIRPVRVKVAGRTYASQPVTVVVRDAPAIHGAPDPQAGPGGQARPNPPASGDPAAAGDAAGSPPGTGTDLAQIDGKAFLRTVADKQEAFIGEQVTVTIYLYVRGRLHGAPMIETEATADGFWVHDLLPPSRTLQPHRQVVQGRPYDAYVIRRFALFPLRAGDLTLGPLTLNVEGGSVFDLFGGGMPTGLRRSSLPFTLRAKPLPPDPKVKGEAAVGRFRIEARWDRDQAATGDAVTLTARIAGEGDIRGAKLDLPPIQGLQVFPPQVRDEVESPGDLVSGTRTYQWLVVPQAPGDYALPDLGPPRVGMRALPPACPSCWPPAVRSTRSTRRPTRRPAMTRRPATQRTCASAPSGPRPLSDAGTCAGCKRAGSTMH